MRRTYLGEFEEMVLLMVALLSREGYEIPRSTTALGPVATQ
ncbi:hypothetical protein CLV42_11315 [Chitinophaga ginsengisoli]|uniref:Uncharacterized protein n=1 Tax=Chitinophaga ginsengisoli TaxID=363837 RepID=A0A2P8FUD4_9BACT|nr:hypothetical protein CLV42_11315 [Chitinophaga ginsengisoli]